MEHQGCHWNNPIIPNGQRSAKIHAGPSTDIGFRNTTAHRGAKSTPRSLSGSGQKDRQDGQRVPLVITSAVAASQTAWVVLLSLALMILGAAPCSGQDGTPIRTSPGQLEIRTGVLCKKIKTTVCFSECDEVWRICARSEKCSCADQVEPKVFQLVDGQWEKRELSTLIQHHEQDTSRKSVFYVHGNRTNAEWSISRASQLYQNIFEPGCGCTPVRFIIWQWTSEAEIPNPLRDFRIKASRAVRAGVAFERVVSQFHAQPTLLIGYSLGAQIIAAAMVQPPATTKNVPQGDVVFVAPIFDESFPATLCAAETSSYEVRETRFLVNPKDPILNLVANPHSTVGRCRNAISVVTASSSLFGDVTICDINEEIANKHSIVEYTTSPSFKATVQELSIVHPSTDLPESTLGLSPKSP